MDDTRPKEDAANEGKGMPENRATTQDEKQETATRNRKCGMMKGGSAKTKRSREGWLAGLTQGDPSVRSVPSLTEGTLSAGPGLGEPGAP